MLRTVIGLLVPAACVWLGFSVQALMGVRLPPGERWALAISLGLAFGAWTLYLTALPFGQLTIASIFTFLTICVLAGVAAKRRSARQNKATLSLVSAGVDRIRAALPEPWFLASVAVAAIALTWMNLYGVFAPLEAGTSAVEHIWADGPYHAALVTNFASGSALPPTYPIAPGEPLAYPFLVDFLTAALSVGGLSLRTSFIAINVAIATGLFALIAAITYRLTKSATTAMLAIFIFCLLGNLGFMSIANDISGAGGFTNWLGNLPWSYSGDAQGGKGRDRLGLGVYLGNPIFMFMNPRRAGAFGMTTAAGAMLLLTELRRRPALGLSILTAITIGMLPRIHTHSAIVIAIVAVCWLATRLDVHTMLAGAVATLISIPQIVAIAAQTTGFVSFHPGWIGEGSEALTTLGSPLLFITFWVVNLGFLVVATGLGLYSRKLRIFVLPFGIVFVLANLFKTQPLAWDNSPYFHFVQLGLTIVSAAGIATLFSRNLDLRAISRTASALFLIIGLTLGGTLSHIYATQQRYFLWTKSDIKMASEVKAITQPGDVILTSGVAQNFHMHPVNALSGRATFAGWSGWLHAHGLDWQRYVSETKQMYDGDLELICERVDYVLVSNFEHFYADQHDLDVSQLLRRFGTKHEGSDFVLLAPNCTRS